MSIPPIIINGQPTCPQGYGLTADGSACLPISPPISVNVAEAAQADLDYISQGLKQARGFVESGWIERFIVAALSSIFLVFQPLIALGMSVYDSALAGLGEVFLGAQAQGTEGFYLLAGALMGDLLGIDVDGKKLWADLQSKGRTAAMTDLGGALFQTLASEFAGEAQKQSGQRFKPTPGAGVGGLPVKDYQAGDGISAAKAFLGFATAFAIREGNTDVLRDLPGIRKLELLDTFKDFAEDFSKSLGIGRMLRVAVRPLMQIMVALPLQYDLNTQYRPSLLGVSDAIRAWKLNRFDDAALDTELSMHGFSPKRIDALKAGKSKTFPIREHRTLLAAGSKPNAAVVTTIDTIAAALAVDEYDKHTVVGWNFALDLDPARRVSLLYVEHYVTLFLEGHITHDAIGKFLDMAQAASGVLLTQGEFDALRALVDSVATNPVLRVRHLPFGVLQLAYIDGTISLNELENHLAQLGYAPNDITILTLETLFKAKQHAAAAAHKVKTGKTGTPTPGSAANPLPPASTPGA